MQDGLKTVLLDRHVQLGAKIVDFSGWRMPMQFGDGIVAEHLATRKNAGLFDVSHMGRFLIRGKNALPFLQYLLTNNAEALELEESQYTFIPNQRGDVVDDAYLYRFVEDEYLLVVNAANREKDWALFQIQLKNFDQVELIDQTFATAMISLQGPLSKDILLQCIDTGYLPEPLRNTLSTAFIKGAQVSMARTGYTGEPLCFELFCDRNDALMIWDLLLSKGAVPVGLGARDTLRIEAALPLYGHELGLDPEGKEIPIFACPLAKFAVSLSPLKGNFIGRKALQRQFEAFKKITARDFTACTDLPRMVMPVAVKTKGVARQGCKVFKNFNHVGYVTSGTMIPYWQAEGKGLHSHLTDKKKRRAICLALIDSRLYEGDQLRIEIRGKLADAVIVPYHLRSEAPPIARPILYNQIHQSEQAAESAAAVTRVQNLISKSIDNTVWRRQQCINLIPSEQTPSPMAKLLSIMDPAARYAEHKIVPAFNEAEVFYYQGTDFIAEVETLLQAEICGFLNCSQAETRVVSGQMANTAVFSAMVDYLNRADRKNEQRRIRKVMNTHIIKGGHLSAQPMGALRDFVARDPQTERPAVVNFPALAENPYKTDVAACRELIAAHQPELVIFGKSMTLHPEPIQEIRAMVDELGLDCILMYDMAHVLGLAGPYFQQPFMEGADLVTASTHKTFFGTQRGIIAADYQEEEPGFEFWDALLRRTFPGSVSNHHLGTLLGLLAAAQEMNYFKDKYQKSVLINAKVFAQALKACGLGIAGDPAVCFTETHQVILKVGYAQGPAIARRLEENNIIVNYQAAPDEEGFTAAGALRMGVQEMTRFGMAATDFQILAQLIHDVISADKNVREEVIAFRKQFLDLKYCFQGPEFEQQMQRLHQLI